MYGVLNLKNFSNFYSSLAMSAIELHAIAVLGPVNEARLPRECSGGPHVVGSGKTIVNFFCLFLIKEYLPENNMELIN